MQTAQCDCGCLGTCDHWVDGCESYPVHEGPEGYAAANAQVIVDAAGYRLPPEATGYPDEDAPVCKIGAERISAD